MSADDSEVQDDDSAAKSAAWFAILVPVIGLFMGLALFARGDSRAVEVILTAVVAAIVWAIALSIFL